MNTALCFPHKILDQHLVGRNTDEMRPCDELLEQ